MKKVIVLFTLSIGATLMFAQQSTQKIGSVPPNPIEKPGWQLTFQEEFDRPKLDDAKWYPAYRTGRMEYMKRIGAETRFLDSNAHYLIEDGILKLRVDENLPFRPQKVMQSVSCIMTSDHRFGETTETFQILEKFSQKYGWFEIRCKTVRGPGVYSAFWLHQTDPTDQEYTPEGVKRKVGDGVVEIDIFEQWSWLEKQRIDFNVHFTKDGTYACMLDFDPCEDFHIYALEWKEGELNWYIDGKKVYTYSGPTPQKKMFILVALFHRPGHKGGKFELDQLTYPLDFEVDYIRVYQAKP